MSHTLRPSKVTPAVRAEITRLSSAGFNRYEIAETVGIHPVYAGKLARDAGVPCAKRVRKLDDTDLVDIRARIAAGESLGSIARLYDVDKALISHIKAGKR